MPTERVATCLRKMHGSTVDVLYSPELCDATYSGLETCSSVWLCAVCSAKISERRRVELGAAVAAWKGEVVLATYTIRHRSADDLGRSVDGLLKARRLARSGEWSQKFNSRYGVGGSVRALEVTHGQNGWHPHIHELLFVAGGVDRQELLEELRARWSAMVGKAGLRDVNEHGVDVQIADMTVADYVAKFGHTRTWGPEHEVAKAVSKRGRSGGRTPVDLLAAATFDGDHKAGRLWRHYALTFKGRRQLVWSAGLRELLGLGAETSDVEIAEDVKPYSHLLASLSAAQWRAILRLDLRMETLQIASRGDTGALWEFLGALGC